MKGILFGQLVLLLVFVIHTIMKCQATFCTDHYNRLMEEIRGHEGNCSDQVKNRSPCCDAEASSLEERRRNYKILCQEEIICGSAREDCSKNATCTNTGPASSYKCTCNKGHFGDGKTCIKAFDMTSPPDRILQSCSNAVLMGENLNAYLRRRPRYGIRDTDVINHREETMILTKKCICNRACVRISEVKVTVCVNGKTQTYTIYECKKC